MLSLTFISNKPLTSINTQAQNFLFQINPGDYSRKYSSMYIGTCQQNITEWVLMQRTPSFGDLTKL